MKICYNERDQKPDTRTYSDKRINDLSARVKKVHKNQTVEVRYMRLMEKIYESMEEGRAEGRAEDLLEYLDKDH